RERQADDARVLRRFSRSLPRHGGRRCLYECRRLSARRAWRSAFRAHRRRLLHHPWLAAFTGAGFSPSARAFGAMTNERPFILCLTGSLGMGKSRTASLFAEQGVPVYDSDAAVHVLYAGEAAPLIESAFPGTTSDGQVDRAKLAARVVGDSAALAKVEAIVHPLVARARD